MIHYFTNREIAKKLDINLARWKRWSRSFLPPDPLGGRQSGYARQYIFKDLLKVFLGGHLLSHVKLSIPESQQVLADLSPWLKKTGFLDVNGSMETQALKTASAKPYCIYFRSLSSAGEKNGSAFAYLIRQTMSRQCNPSAVDRHVTEIIAEAFINWPTAEEGVFLQDPKVHLINITALFIRLTERLSHHS